jgi:hypothetical protein
MLILRLAALAACLGLGVLTAAAQFVEAPQYLTATGQSPMSLAVGDFNGDGYDDVAVVDSTGVVSVFLNKGDGKGTLLAPSSYSVGTTATTYVIAAAKFTSAVGLAVADSSGNLVILVNNGSGGFTVGAPIANSGASFASITAGDLTGNGLADIVAGDSQSGKAFVFQNNGGGAFGAAHVFATTLNAPQPIFVALGNFVTSTTTQLDLAVMAQDGTIAVLPSISGGTSFGSPIITTNGNTYISEVTAVAVGDMNADGWADLVVTNLMDLQIYGPAAQDVLNMADGSGTFYGSYAITQPTFAVGPSPVAVAVADANSSGYLGEAIASNTDNTVGIALEPEIGGATQPIAEFGTGLSPVSLAFGNLTQGTGQRYPDLAVANMTGNSVSVLVNEGLNSTTQAWNGLLSRDDWAVGVGSLKKAEAVATVNIANPAPAVPDAIVATPGGLFYLTNDGNGNFTYLYYLSYGFSLTPPISLVATDLNGDGYGDVAVIDATGALNVFLNSSASPGAFTQSTYSITTGASSFVLASGSFQAAGQNLPDLAVGDSNGNVTVLTNQSSSPGTFTVQPAVSVSGVSFSSMAVADYNGDGTSDVAAADSVSGSLYVFRGAGSGVLAPPFSGVATGLSTGVPVFVASGSFLTQYEAVPDLAAADANGDLTILPNVSSSGTIGFGTPVSFPASSTGVPAGVTALAALDFNADGLTDVAFVNGQTDQLYALKNTATGGVVSFASPLLSVTGADPVAAAVADLNGDGTPDMVLANQNSNTMSELLNGGGSVGYVRVTLVSSVNPAPLGVSISFTATLAPTLVSRPAPTGTVTFLDGSTAIGSAAVVSSGSGNSATATFSLSTLATGTHEITASYGGDSNFAPGQTVTPLAQVVLGPEDFALSGSPGTVSVGAGSPANFTIKATAINAFTGTITLACSGLSAGLTCQFSPDTLTLTASGYPATSTLTISTTVQSSELSRPAPGGRSRLPALRNSMRAWRGGGFWVLAIAPFGLAMLPRRRRRTRLRIVLLALLVLACGLGVACGGSSSSNQSSSNNVVPAGSYTITVTGTSGALVHSAQVLVRVN